MCQSVIREIHASGWRVVLSVTGGGAGAIGRLLEVPGGSISVAECIVPYNASALSDWIGGVPDQFCSQATARAMAMAAFERARALAPDGPHVGLGCTASLATDRPKKGALRAHVATQTATQTTAYHVNFANSTQRDFQQQQTSALIISAIAKAIGVSGEMPLAVIPTCRHQIALPEWSELLLGKREVVWNPKPSPKPTSQVDATDLCVFSGAFNPLHDGHRRMIEIAQMRTGKPVWLEVTIANVDKPALDFLVLRRRLDRLKSHEVVLTRAARFTQKAELFPRATFVIGADTLLRLADPKYYHDEPLLRDAAMDYLANSGSRFIVFGRCFDGTFLTTCNMNLPDRLLALCDDVPGDEFREDISSTQLRNE